MRCIRCHRTLIREPVDGLGPVCFAKVGKPAPHVERDLFGFDIPAAAAAAVVRLAAQIEWMGIDARIELRNAFAAARRRLGVWA